MPAACRPKKIVFNHPNGVALDQARSAAVALGAKVVSRVGVPGFLVQGYSVGQAHAEHAPPLRTALRRREGWALRQSINPPSQGQQACTFIGDYPEEPRQKSQGPAEGEPPSRLRAALAEGLVEASPWWARGPVFHTRVAAVRPQLRPGARTKNLVRTEACGGERASRGATPPCEQLER